jgi:hypothetical protein
MKSTTIAVDLAKNVFQGAVSRHPGGLARRCLACEAAQLERAAQNSLDLGGALLAVTLCHCARLGRRQELERGGRRRSPSRGACTDRRD